MSVYGPPTGTGGAGGAGVYLGAGTLTNTGIITGGAGGLGLAQGGAGGVGVWLDYGTLVTSGTITGGAGGHGNVSDGATGDAVVFAQSNPFYAATLIIEAGAVFNGLVVASLTAHDVLELGGSAAGTIGGLGTDFTNFPTITEAAGAHWTLDGLNMLGGATALQLDGLLNVTGSLVANGPVSVGAHGDLSAGAGGEIDIGAELTLAGGTLSGQGAFSVGAGPGVGPSGTISGFGTIANGNVYDGGTVVATGGTLSLQRSSIQSSGATFLIDSNAVLQIGSGGFLSDVVFAAGGRGHLIIGGALATATAGTLTGFGSGDVIDLTKLGASAADFSGGVLAVPDGAHTDILTFTGGITAANLRFTSDGHGGTDVSYAPAAAIRPPGAAQAAQLDTSLRDQTQSGSLPDMILEHWHV
jgi:hypothetical protein